MLELTLIKLLIRKFIKCTTRFKWLHCKLQNLKKHPASLNDKATFAVSFPNRAQGVLRISLGSSITSALKAGRYSYDVLLNDGSLKTRIVSGSAIVTAGVTTG